jgi:molybdopterin molybdotransferase
MMKLGDVAFWKIAMRPAGPWLSGRIGPAILFGLPGNPVAVMVTFLAFVRPALLRMMGCTRAPPPLLKARSEEPIRKKAGRTEYQRGVVTAATDGSLQVRTTGNQGSGVLGSMVQANGLIVLHHGQGSVAAGDLVDVMMFEGSSSVGLRQARNDRLSFRNQLVMVRPGLGLPLAPCGARTACTSSAPRRW